MIQPARPTTSSDRLLREQVRLLFQHVPAMLAAAGIVSVVLAFSARRVVGSWYIAAWLASILGVGIARVGLDHRFAKDARQPRRAASMVAMSIFFIGIIALKTRLASPPPAASASVSARGVICQERPQRSLHQPH
jgi:hypothetical protein